MTSNQGSALDVLRRAFGWLVTGPHPVSVDGALIGRVGQRVPLDVLREELLSRRHPQAVRDRVWRELMLRSRRDGTERAVWTLAAAGAALPGLVTIAADCCAMCPSLDPDEVDAAVLAGFVAALAVADPDRPGVLTRLRWAAFRAGTSAVTAAVAAATPIGGPGDVAAAEPRGAVLPAGAAAGGDPSVVLARAVRAGVLRAEQADLIASTRLDGVSLGEAAERLGVSYAAVRHRRARAERRLLAHLVGAPSADPPVDWPTTVDPRAAAPVTAAPVTAAPSALALPVPGPVRFIEPGSDSATSRYPARAARDAGAGLRGTEGGVARCG